MSTQPKLADLVRAGDAQTEALAVTPFLFLAHGVSNAHLVTTSDGETRRAIVRSESRKGWSWPSSA